jgi:hypothetical protein
MHDIGCNFNSKRKKISQLQRTFSFLQAYHVALLARQDESFEKNIFTESGVMKGTFLNQCRNMHEAIHPSSYFLPFVSHTLSHHYEKDASKRLIVIHWDP